MPTKTMSIVVKLSVNVRFEKHSLAAPRKDAGAAELSAVGRTCGRVLSPTANDAMPTGTLMRKMPSHAKADTMAPPSTGPTIMPRATNVESRPMARPRSRDGKASVMMPMLLAMAAAQPMPCTTRAAMSVGSVWARPHSSDQSVKTTTPAWNT